MIKAILIPFTAISLSAQTPHPNKPLSKELQEVRKQLEQQERERFATILRMQRESLSPGYTYTFNPSPDSSIGTGWLLRMGFATAPPFAVQVRWQKDSVDIRVNPAYIITVTEDGWLNVRKPVDME